MPYIDKWGRRAVDHGELPVTAGELNYKISTLVDQYISGHGGVNYGNINAVLGVLTAVQLELYRRLAAPYEDKKMAENGDVFTAPAARSAEPCSVGCAACAEYVGEAG